jgi:hypothetical protein
MSFGALHCVGRVAVSPPEEASVARLSEELAKRKPLACDLLQAASTGEAWLAPLKHSPNRPEAMCQVIDRACPQSWLATCDLLLSDGRVRKLASTLLHDLQ